jgi:hypothetical protein
MKVQAPIFSKKIENGVMPTSKTDRLAMFHDINYLLATGKPEFMDIADDKAINQASFFNPQGLVMILGLEARKVSHIKENEGTDNTVTNIEKGFYLKNKILYDPYWASLKATQKDFIL